MQLDQQHRVLARLASAPAGAGPKFDMTTSGVDITEPADAITTSGVGIAKPAADSAAAKTLTTT